MLPKSLVAIRLITEARDSIVRALTSEDSNSSMAPASLEPVNWLVDLAGTNEEFPYLEYIVVAQHGKYATVSNLLDEPAEPLTLCGGLREAFDKCEIRLLPVHACLPPLLPDIA